MGTNSTNLQSRNPIIRTLIDGRDSTDTIQRPRFTIIPISSDRRTETFNSSFRSPSRATAGQKLQHSVSLATPDLRCATATPSVCYSPSRGRRLASQIAPTRTSNSHFRSPELLVAFYGVARVSVKGFLEDLVPDLEVSRYTVSL